MMINDMKKNELNDLEMKGVAGGFGGSDAVLHWQEMQRELQKQEEARQKAEAIRQKIMQNEAAKQEAIRQAEAENQPGTYVHGGGVSGGW